MNADPTEQKETHDTPLGDGLSIDRDAFAARIDQYDWSALGTELDGEGHALLPGLLPREHCRALALGYDDDARYRSRVVMARHGFGRGEYRYFRYPLPAPVQSLREGLYPPLARVAQAWNQRLGIEVDYPTTLEGFLDRCHRAGQQRPTPLLLRYRPGDYNCLHQDLYGEQVFPLQVAILLSEPRRDSKGADLEGADPEGTDSEGADPEGAAIEGGDFEGGEFVLTEQRPRMQSRVAVVPLRQGDAVVFAVNQRPVRGARGDYRVAMRHGVSRVRAGERHTLGVIFHDAS